MKRLVVTRAWDALAADDHNPDPAWAGWLNQGWQVCHWPLIEIASVTDSQTLDPVRAAWQNWSDWQAVMWVSASAARHFFKHRPQGHQWGEVRAWCTGPGTAQVVLGLGVPETCLVHPQLGDAQWDSESLWARVQPQLDAHAPVLRVRGRDQSQDPARGSIQGQGRDWLADQLAARGIPVHTVAVYERALPQWTLEQKNLALEALNDGTIWWFTSSQAIHHLQQLLPGKANGRSRAVVTHPRIAASCRELGWGQVLLSAPDAVSVMKSIESFQ